MGQPFEPYGTSHWVMLAIFVAGIPLVVALGRRVRHDPDRRRRLCRAAAVGILAFTLPLQALDFLPGRFDLGITLPLQLCDLAWMVAAYALWTQRPTAAAVTYYWGLVLSSQALLTPSLSWAFPDPRFVAFWGMHLLIVWAAIFLPWGLGIRPTWREYRATVAVTLAWMATVLVFNSLTDTNYGYLNRKPPTASALDYLGPWPWYLLVQVLLVATVWALMTWPWVRSRTPRAAPVG